MTGDEGTGDEGAGDEGTANGRNGGHLEGNLARALEREHREIDRGIESFTHGRAAAESLLPAMEALRRHIYLEEEFLFPPLREAGLMMPIMVMIREHGRLWDSMGSIERLLGGSAAGEAEGAGRDLLALLASHNSKEEPILYSQADPILSTDAAATLHEFIDAGRMPEGWVCERATR